MLVARPLFTAIIVAAVSIGVGGVATIFSGLNALVLRPLPGVTGGDRLVLIDRRTPDFTEGTACSFSPSPSRSSPGLIFGIVPALRGAGRNPVSLLRSSSAGASRRMLTTKSLIVAQMVVLLTIAGLFIRALVAGASIDPGFDARGVALVSFNTQSFGYDPERGREFYKALRHRLEATPGVEAVTYADRIPLTMSNSGATVSIDGGAADQQRARMRVEAGIVDTNYFETVGIRLLSGREFTSTDVAGGRAVAIVNETFARRAWPDRSPAAAAGQTYFAGERPVTIVGVAADSKYSTLSEPPTPFVYRPQAQLWNTGQTLFVRVSGDSTTGPESFRTPSRPWTRFCRDQP